jgi:hypothetical protein
MVGVHLDVGELLGCNFFIDLIFEMGIVGDEDGSFIGTTFGGFENGGCFSASEYGVDGDILFLLDRLDDRGLLWIEDDR